MARPWIVIKGYDGQQSLDHLSNRAIGRQLGITHATVARYAAELGGHDG